MAPIDAEQHARQQQLVLEMIDQLRGALDGRLSRGEVGAWARSVWPESAVSEKWPPCAWVRRGARVSLRIVRRFLQTCQMALPLR